MVNWFAANRQGFVDLIASLGLSLPPPDWRTLFLLNLPVSLVALIGVLWALRGVKQERAKGGFDILGTALISGALICVVAGLGANIEIATTAASFDDVGGLPSYALPVLAAGGFALIWRTWTLEVADALIAFEMALVGIGLGLTFSPISAAVIDTADQDKLGTASALVIIMRLLGMTISIALLTSTASARLSYLAALELGPNLVDAYQAIDVYSRLTVQVLSEMGLAGAIICLVGLLPALGLQSRLRASARRDLPAPQSGD